VCLGYGVGTGIRLAARYANRHGEEKSHLQALCSLNVYRSRTVDHQSPVGDLDVLGHIFEFCLRGVFRLGSGRRPLTQLEEIADLWLPKCAQVICRKRGFHCRVRRYQGLELVRGSTIRRPAWHSGGVRIAGFREIRPIRHHRLRELLLVPCKAGRKRKQELPASLLDLSDGSIVI
jgi:hypothetical protein